MKRQVPRIRLNMNIERTRPMGDATPADYAYVIGVNLTFVGVIAGAMAAFIYVIMHI